MMSIFFVHGFWSTPQIWKEYQMYFRSMGYRTVAPALPQHFSKNQVQHPAKLNLSSYVDQLEEDYRALEKDADSITIVGHGAGALLAMQLAMRTNPASLVLMAPEMPSNIGSVFANARKFVDVCTTPFFWRRGVKPNYRSAKTLLFNEMSDEATTHAYEAMCFESGQALYQTWFWYADPHSESFIEREQIQCPVMTLSGSEDQYCSPRDAKKLSRFLGQGRFFHTAVGYGHMLPLEDESFTLARQIHVWLCWQLGMQKSDQLSGLNTATV